MSLFDSILSQVSGSGQINPLLNVVTNMLGHPTGGGLAGMLEQFAAAGLSQQVSSWVSTGPNQPISADHIHQVFGSEKIQQIAQQLGMDPGHVADQLAALIPQVVDRLTPNGSVPAAGVQGTLAGLVQSFLKPQS